MDPMAAQSNRTGVFALLLCWLIAAGTYVTRAVMVRDSTPLILDTDDAMRLTNVRDLLGGQNWFDVVQHRLNTPYGAEIHWSRLIDVPEASLLWLLRRFVDPGMADIALAYAWPLLLLAVALWLSGKLALRFGGRSALWPGMLLPIFSLATMAEFSPGRLDHHSAQILLALIMLYCTVMAIERPRFAPGAAIAAALSLAIGIEGLPAVAATALAFGLLWIGDIRHRVALRDFGLSFALATALALAQGVPPDRWFVPMVDAISIVYATAALCCALAFLALSLAPLGPWWQRLIGGALLGTLVLAITVILFPALRGGPYGALDPWLIANWIDRISEAEPWLTSALAGPVYGAAVAVPCAVALGIVAWNIVRRSPDRSAWLTYGTFLVIAVLVMLLQIRGARLALPLAVPASAVLVGGAWHRMVHSKGFGPIFEMLGSVIASTGLAVAIVAVIVLAAFPAYEATTKDKFLSEKQACLMPGAFADLARLPPQRIMTPIDLGSHMLLFTPHSVVAAPYHRNAQGVRDAFRFFNEPLEQGRAILEARGIGLVVICPDMPEIRGLVDYTPDSFVSLFAQDRLPAWLIDRSLPTSPLKVYEVAPR